MCAEKIEEITAKDAMPSKKIFSSAWAPALTVLIGVPLLSFLFTEYALLPHLKTHIAQALQLPSNINTSSTDGTSPATSIQSYEFKDIISNLIGNGQSRYIRISFVVEGTHANFTDIIKKHEVRLIDTTLSILSLLSADDLTKPNLKDIVRTQLLQNFEQVLQNKYINSIFFSQFIIK